MEWNFFIYSSIILLIFIFYKKRLHYKRLPTPPGPPGWPLFGHIFQLGTIPHRTIAVLKQKYGPVVWLKIGVVNTMVIQSADVASEFFKNHDLSFADRNIIDVMRSRNYTKYSMALAPYGVYWRVMRRLCTVELFVNKRINETVSVRRNCIDHMLQWIEKEANSVEGRRNGVQVVRYIFLATFNTLGHMIMSQDMVDPESKDASLFFTSMKGMMEWSGEQHWILPATFVKKRIEENKAGVRKRKDLLDVLLEFEGGKNEPAKLSESEITVFILEIFFAGSETTSASVEWALTELLRNPETMIKVKN
ncbi:Cytochrome [Forsythia ovata]|uniref:Cytochrome n=1 Tax=Forsythia ovata TaxID=205694 RepID=A0ABD1SR86_9LAMI